MESKSNQKGQEKKRGKEGRGGDDPGEPDDDGRKPSPVGVIKTENSSDDDDARKPSADQAKKRKTPPDESNEAAEDESDEEIEEADDEEAPRKPAPKAAARSHERSSSLDSEPAAPPKRAARKRMRTSETGEEIRVSHQQRWEEMFERLKEFKRKHGHCRVPNRYPQDTQLGSWVSAQRRQYRIVTQGEEGSAALTPERANLLIGIGFEWTTMNPHHTPWETRYEALKEFVRRFGHAEVPMRHEDPKLSHWVSKQRSDYKLRQEGKTSRLTDERLALLNSIGFRWEGSRRSVAQKMRGAGEGVDQGEDGIDEALGSGGTGGAPGLMAGGLNQNANEQARQFLSQLMAPPAAQGNVPMGQQPMVAGPNGLQQLLAAFAPRGLQPPGFATTPDAGGQNAANVQQMSSLLPLLFPQSVAAGTGASAIPAQTSLQQFLSAFAASGAPQQQAAAYQPANAQQQAPPQAPQAEPLQASQQQPDAPQPAAQTPPRQSAAQQGPQQSVSRDAPPQEQQQSQPPQQQPSQQQPVVNNVLQQIMSLLGNQQQATNPGLAFGSGGPAIPIQPMAPNAAQQMAALLTQTQQTQSNNTGLQALLQQALSQPQVGLQFQNIQQQAIGNNPAVIAAGAGGNQAPQYLLVVPLNGLNLPNTGNASNPGVPPAMPLFAFNAAAGENANPAVSSSGQGSGRTSGQESENQNPTSSADISAGAGTGVEESAAPHDDQIHQDSAGTSGGSEARESSQMESESEQSNASHTANSAAV